VFGALNFVLNTMPKKTKEEKPVEKKEPVKSKKEKFVYAVGRRKRATSRVRLYTDKKGEIIVNDKPIEQYFSSEWMKNIYLSPLRTCNVIGKYFITVRVRGSGVNGQLEAVTHGLSRALAIAEPEKFRNLLRKRGFLTRDPRKKERRKVGTGGKARRKKQSPRR
jgi:small subunit ribosomal protein S9